MPVLTHDVRFGLWHLLPVIVGMALLALVLRGWGDRFAGSRPRWLAAAIVLACGIVVVPQLLVATVMGSVMKALFPGEPIWTIAFAAASLLVAAVAMTRVSTSSPRA